MLNPEQHRYLRDRIRVRARFYSGLPTEIHEDEALTLALAWHAAYWRERRDRETGDLFDIEET